MYCRAALVVFFNLYMRSSHYSAVIYTFEVHGVKVWMTYSTC